MEYVELKFLLCISNYMNIIHDENGDSGNCFYYIMLQSLNGDIFIETRCMIRKFALQMLFTNSEYTFCRKKCSDITLEPHYSTLPIIRILIIRTSGLSEPVILLPNCKLSRFIMFITLDNPNIYIILTISLCHKQLGEQGLYCNTCSVIITT